MMFWFFWLGVNKFIDEDLVLVVVILFIYEWIFRN